MKLFTVVAVALALPGVPAAAQWEPPSEVLLIDARGAGAWVLTCALQNKKGETVTRALRGSGKRSQRLSMLEARGGQCSYQAASDQQLTLTMRRGLYSCPLPTETRKGCEQVIEAGGSGRFEIRWLG